MSKGDTTRGDPESVVTLTKEKLDQISKTIQQVYLQDGMPWVIGYSGGKDSTAVLSVVWYALAELPTDKLVKPVFIITSDTGVETPIVVNHLNDTIDHINRGAKKQGLPIEAHKVSPLLEETFWVNMLGRGYPAPTTRFRWCTERLKIAPASRFIEEKVAKYGEVVVVLGARRSESATRGQLMRKRDKASGTRGRLSRHTTLSGAWVFTPIEDWSRQDVWVYLLSWPSPWGSDHRDLVAMYKNAQGGECPLVVDKSTPPCGNSRFGCWTCTLVERDKSMEGAINRGSEWLLPLLELREWLMATRDPEDKHKYREHRRRTGRIQFMKSGEGMKIIWGPYKMEVRKDILKRLLQAQKHVQERGPVRGATLITEAELRKIRQVWRFEEGDWGDSLPRIYREVFGQDLQWTEEDWSGMGGMEQTILSAVCAEHNLPERLLTELFDAERKRYGMSRRTGIYDEIDSVLKKDWRSREAALAETTACTEPAASSEGQSDAD